MTCCSLDREDRNRIWRDSEVNFKQSQIEDISHLKSFNEKSQSEEVNHPSHYHKASGFEVIDVIDAWGLDFTLGNSIKYISRAGHKNKDKTEQDLQKALWYLLRAMNKEDKYKDVVSS